MFCSQIFSQEIYEEQRLETIRRLELAEVLVLSFAQGTRASLILLCKGMLPPPRNNAFSPSLPLPLPSLVRLILGMQWGVVNMNATVPCPLSTCTAVSMKNNAVKPIAMACVNGSPLTHTATAWVTQGTPKDGDDKGRLEWYLISRTLLDIGEASDYMC